MPVTDHSAIVRFAEPAPITRSVSFSACALPPGSRLSVLSGSRQQGLEEPCREVNRTALGRVERGPKIARGSRINWALPARRAVADAERFCRIARRSHAAD